MDCCATWDGNQLIGETELMHARLDGFPVAPGHALVIPKRHVVAFANLWPEEVLEMHGLIAEICRTTNAQGFTIGINEGRAAGRTVHHLHVHVIPRRLGDVLDPRGGVRRVLIPDTATDPYIAQGQSRCPDGIVLHGHLAATPNWNGRRMSQAELRGAVADLHRRVLAGIGDGQDLATAGRRSIVERHSPGEVMGAWIGCSGPHGREDTDEWPCADYRDAAGEAGNPLPPEQGFSARMDSLLRQEPELPWCSGYRQTAKCDVDRRHAPHGKGEQPAWFDD